jgi:iron-sulfur cluster assembly protein
MTETAQSVSITPAAIKAAKDQLSKRSTGQNDFLRLGITGSGCHGYSYALSFTDKQYERDLSFDFDGLKVLIDSKSMLYLAGSTLDYETSLMKKGFKFINPHATSSCGCGDSFGVESTKPAWTGDTSERDAIKGNQ